MGERNEQRIVGGATAMQAHDGAQENAIVRILNVCLDQNSIGNMQIRLLY